MKPIRWSEPTVEGVRQFIRNPAYAGGYVYGRRHWRRVLAGLHPVPDHKLIGQFVERWDHHPGYTTKEEFFANQRTLGLNAKTPKQSQLGPGAALLQSRCFCGTHGSMVVHYSPRGRERSWSFRCLGDYLKGGPQCVSVPGPPLEKLLVDAMLQTLDAPIIEEAHRLWKSHRGDWRRRHRHLQRELERKREQHTQLKERVARPAPGMHPRVLEMLESEFAKLAEEMERLEQRTAHEEVEQDPFTDERWAELERLCADVRGIWEAPTTTLQDRKQLVRMLVHRVVIETVAPELIEFRIEWSDDLPAKRLKLLRPAYYHHRIWEWHLKGLSLDAIVGELGALGARTQQGRIWSRERVRTTIAARVKRARLAGDIDALSALPMRPKPGQVILELHAAGIGAEQIADRLNAMGLPTHVRTLWSASSVRRVILEKAGSRALARVIRLTEYPNARRGI